MSPRVLIIDDEADWRETFEDIFVTTGFQADTASGVTEAKDALRATTYDLLVLDIFLAPSQVPLAYQRFLSFLKRTYPNTKVVATTGKPLPPNEAFKLHDLSVVGFIYKPHIELDQLRTLALQLVDTTASEPEPSQLLERLDNLERRLDARLVLLGGSVAEITGLTRAILRLASTDISDCPRLFTLRESTPERRIVQAAQVTYILTLWCEYPGAEHAWEPATYTFRRPRQWLHKVAPYGLLVSRALRMTIPIAATLPGMVLAEKDLKRVQHQLELMKAVASQLPETAATNPPPIVTGDRLRAEEGAGLRALHSVLLTEDSDRIFGDLRKVGTEQGDILWVCPHHGQTLGTTLH